MAPPCRVFLPAEKARVKRMWSDREYTVADIGKAVSASEGLITALAANMNLPSRASTGFSWSPELDALARPLFEAAGGKAAAERLNIAGLTGRVITNRASRMKWKFEGTFRKPPAPSAAAGQLTGAQGGPRMAKATKARPDPVCPANPKILAHHRAGECLFPVGPEIEPNGHRQQLFCCDPVLPGHRYCGPHHRFAHQPGVRK